jgi:hypothetical protein
LKTTCEDPYSKIFGLESYVFESLVDLAPIISRSLIGNPFNRRLYLRASGFARNYNDNLFSATDIRQYLHGFIDLTHENTTSVSTSKNSLIDIPVLSLPLFCPNEMVTFSFNTHKLDSGIIRYAFSPVFKGKSPNDTIGYVSPYTFNKPISSQIPLNLDSSTGSFQFLCNKVERVAVGMAVYRLEPKTSNPSLYDTVGYSVIDFPMSIATGGFCGNTAPSIDTSSLNAQLGLKRSCRDTSLTLYFNKPIIASSVSPSGSEFKIKDFRGNLLPVDSAIPLSIDSNGCAKSVQLNLALPFTNNGIYILGVKKGIDGNSIYSSCFVEMLEDTAVEISVWNCPQGQMAPTLTNVSVDTSDNRSLIVDFIKPIDFDDYLFHSYQIKRIDDLGNIKLDSIMNPFQLRYIDRDRSLSLDQHVYRYSVRIRYGRGSFKPSNTAYSNTISNYRLMNVPISLPADSNVNLSWDLYSGWNASDYMVQVQFDSLVGFEDRYSVNGLSTLLGKPDVPGRYATRLLTYSPDSLRSYSNAIYFEVPPFLNRPAYVISPNGDGVNDTWVMDRGRFKRKPRVCIQNIMGGTVFQTDSYQDDWGAGIPIGLYFYTIESKDGDNKVLYGKIYVSP